MIKGDNVRPLLVKGEIHNINCIMGRLCASNEHSDEKINHIQFLTSGDMDRFRVGFNAYIFEDAVIANEIKGYLDNTNTTYLLNVSNIRTLCEYDVVEFGSSLGIINILYRANSYDNALMLTNQCNSNCIFCPESENARFKKNYTSLDKISELIKLIPDDVPYLCITGGEPTLLKKDFIHILKYCKGRFKNTQFLILSNGRLFSYADFTYEYVNVRPEGTIVGIALHADNEEVHDRCTGVRNSFKQSLSGICHLYGLKEKIEIRIVVNKMNYKLLPKMAEMIIKRFPNIYRVNIMGLEMLGNAAKNREDIWIGFEIIGRYVNEAVILLIRNGIKTNLYNFPLCFINKKFWQITLPSISDYKVRFAEECIDCSVKDICGGFFQSTYSIGNITVNPI